MDIAENSGNGSPNIWISRQAGEDCIAVLSISSRTEAGYSDLRLAMKSLRDVEEIVFMFSFHLPNKKNSRKQFCIGTIGHLV